VHSARDQLAEESGTALWPWAVLLLALASAAASVWAMRRRRKAAEAVAAPSPEVPEVALPAPDAAPPLQFELALDEPPETPAEPVAAEPEPLAETEPLPQEAQAPRPALSLVRNPLEITLQARRMNATLFNTTLQYELAVTNHTGEQIGPLLIACDMVAAHASIPTKAQLEIPGQGIAPSHRVASLGPGESAILPGELRLPLAAITPIRNGKASLFVPLARFHVEAARRGGPPLAASRTFVVGQSAEKPGAALKPFRLDLGPRLYSRLGQREVAAHA
jgi:hypothetical protein